MDPLLPTLYDGLDRLKQVKSANQWGLASYSYDPLDNLRSNQLGATTLTYSYDAGNRLSSLTNGLGSTWSITTDGRGNITANALKAQAYQFDLAHRMNAVTGKESYLYDGHGRRARTLNLQTGTIEYYGYGKDGRLLQDWSNRRQVRNGYVYLGNTVVGLYEVNLTNGTVTPKYQHTDALGSPVVTTKKGTLPTDPPVVLSRMSYTPCGLPTLPMDGVGYTGDFMDVGTQLTYMQQRYYDPQIGRFIAIDPISADPTGNFNRYWYANDNPLRFYDPDGRMSGLVELFKAFIGMPSSGDTGPKQEPANFAVQVGQQVREGAKKAKEEVKAVCHEVAKTGDRVSLAADTVAIATVELPPVSLGAETVSTAAAVTAAVAEPNSKRVASIFIVMPGVKAGARLAEKATGEVAASNSVRGAAALLEAKDQYVESTKK